MKNYVTLFISMLFLAGCSKKTDTFVTTISEADGFTRNMEVVYSDSIIYIKGTESDVKGTYKDTMVLYRNNHGYYKIIQDISTKPIGKKQVQVLSLKDSSFSRYDDVTGRHDVYTLKLDSTTYMSVSNAYGMATMCKTIYYTTSYKIIRIDELYGTYKFVFTSSLYKDHKIPKIPHAPFLDKIKKDSLDYSKNIHVEY